MTSAAIDLAITLIASPTVVVTSAQTMSILGTMISLTTVSLISNIAFIISRSSCSPERHSSWI